MSDGRPALAKMEGPVLAGTRSNPFLRTRWPQHFALAGAVFACGLVGLVGEAKAVQPPSASAGDAYFSQARPLERNVFREPSWSARSEARVSTGPAGAGTVPDNAEAFEPGEVVAIVGKEPIFVGDMLLEVNQLLNEHLPNAPREVRDRERRRVIRALAERFVEAELLYQDGIAGLPEGVKIDQVLKQAEKEFDDKALPALMKRSGIDTVEAYDAHLRMLGSSLRHVRAKWAREQLAAHLVRSKLQINEDIPPAEMLDWYREHQDEFRHEARVRWEELMVRFDRFPSRQEARAQIVEMGNEVAYGASFAAVARSRSHGFSAPDGGVYDWTTRGSLASPEIADVIFSIPVDYLSEIIETRHGLHIVRVIERKEACTTSFRDAQPEIREKLLAGRREQAIKDHIAALRRKIPVEIVFDP